MRQRLPCEGPSQRHTFISNLARAGVHPRNAQALARHSTIDLTMNVYTHVAMSDLHDDVESMPGLRGQGRDERTAATGQRQGTAAPRNALGTGGPGPQLGRPARAYSQGDHRADEGIVVPCDKSASGPRWPQHG